MLIYKNLLVIMPPRTGSVTTKSLFQSALNSRDVIVMTHKQYAHHMAKTELVNIPNKKVVLLSKNPYERLISLSFFMTLDWFQDVLPEYKFLSNVVLSPTDVTQEEYVISLQEHLKNFIINWNAVKKNKSHARLNDDILPLWLHTQTDYYQTIKPDHIVHIENVIQDFAALGVPFDPKFKMNSSLNKSDRPRFFDRFTAFTKETLALVDSWIKDEANLLGYPYLVWNNETNQIEEVSTTYDSL